MTWPGAFWKFGESPRARTPARSVEIPPWIRRFVARIANDEWDHEAAAAQLLRGIPSGRRRQQTFSGVKRVGKARNALVAAGRAQSTSMTTKQETK